MKKNNKNTFWFSVAHAMKKNFILPLLTFAVSMFFLSLQLLLGKDKRSKRNSLNQRSGCFEDNARRI